MSNENENENTVVGGPQAVETNSMLWEDIDAEKVRAEFKSMIKDLGDLREELEALAKEAKNFDKTKELIEKIRDKDFSSSGWIASFAAENANAFPSIKGDTAQRAARPDWYFMKPPEVRKKYDDILDYMDDATKLKEFFAPYAQLLTRLPLADTFRIFCIIRNMKSKGWNEGEYKLINQDIESVCSLLTRGWADMNAEAKLSERFYQEHIAEMESPKVKEGYIKQRQEDYLAILKKYAIYSSLRYKGNGKYYLYGERMASAKTLDKYMAKIVGSKDLGDRLKALLASSETLQNSLMSNIVLHSGAGRSLHQAMIDLMIVIRYFMTCSLEEFTKFREGSDEAPYCYMKCPEAAGKSRGYFGFEPKWDDSWSTGTEYYEIYRKTLFAVSAHCHDFVYVHGKVH